MRIYYFSVVILTVLHFTYKEKHCASFILGVIISCMTFHWILKLKYKTPWIVITTYMVRNRVKEGSKEEDSKPNGEKDVRMPLH